MRRRYFLGVFYLKVLTGCLLSLIYTHYYTDRSANDTFSYFDDAAIIYSSLEEDPAIYMQFITGIGNEDPAVREYTSRLQQWIRLRDFEMINDNRTIIRANALVMLFSLGHYYVHVVFWCFFSLLGLTALFRACTTFFPRKKWALFLAIFLLPTVLFWSSGVLKEGLMLLGLGFFVRYFLKACYGQISFRHGLYLLLAALLLFFSKSYILLALIPALISVILIRLTGPRHYLLKSIGVHVVLLILFYSGSAFLPDLNYLPQMEAKRLEFITVAKEAGAGSLLQTDPVGSVGQNLSNIPAALFRTYFRPLPWEIFNVMYVPAVAENVFFLLCLALMVWNFRKPFRLERDLVLFSLSFVLAMGYIIGSTVPVLGAIVRYKMPALIFLFVTIFACTDHLLLQRRLPFLRRFLRKL